MKKIKIFTGNDLDSAGSLMLIKWAFGDMYTIEHSISNIFNIKRDYEDHIYGKNCDEYSKIFILNMIPDFEVNDDTMVFSKSDKLDLRFVGKVGISTSTTGLIQNFFKKTLSNLTSKQHKFIDTIKNFYIDNGRKTESMKLNAIFNYGRNKYSEFYNRFIDGLDEYTDEEISIIKNYSIKLTKTYKHLELFEHKGNEGMYIALVDDMFHKHEILDLLFKKLTPKMVFLVDLNDGFISVRKNDSLKLDMHKLCNTMIQGRALKNCAGGRYTEKFLDFSRAFM